MTTTTTTTTSTLAATKAKESLRIDLSQRLRPLNLSDLARTSGIPRRTLDRVRNGKGNPTMESLVLIQAAVEAAEAAVALEAERRTAELAAKAAAAAKAAKAEERAAARKAAKSAAATG